MPRQVSAKLAAILCFSIAACSTDNAPYEVVVRPADRSQAEIDFAKQVLNDLQKTSIDKNREYCGYIGLSPQGGYYATNPTRGRKGSCFPKAEDTDINLLASFHTHGGYSDRFESETPSMDDVNSGLEESLDGYIATPGGRLWFTNGETGASEMLCGIGCLIMDPNFEPNAEPNIKTTYTLEALGRLED